MRAFAPVYFPVGSDGHVYGFSLDDLCFIKWLVEQRLCGHVVDWLAISSRLLVALLVLHGCFKHAYH